MAPLSDCMDNPSEIFAAKFCLDALSKNLSGLLTPVRQRTDRCASRQCETLKTIHRLELEVKRHDPCDSDLAKAFDGKLVITRFTTAYLTDGHHRGFHAGAFTWTGSKLRVVGRIAGVTNVGTHRLPVFQECQKCDDLGVLEGRLCGKVTTQNSALRDSRIVADYRIRFDPSKTLGGSGGVRGTLEGVIILQC